MGVLAVYNGATVLIGSDRLMAENDIDVSELKQRLRKSKAKVRPLPFWLLTMR